MKRRPLILLILFILLLLTLWLGREGWLPFFKSWLPQLAGDIGSQIQSIEAFVALIVLIGGGIFGSWSWLTRNDQTNRRSEELSPLRATTWQAIRDRSPQGAPIQWIDRSATDANKLRAQPRVALMGLSGEGKTREAAELIQRAVELDLVAATQVFEPNRNFLNTDAAVTITSLDKVVDPAQRAFLVIDDLHSYSATALEQLATLVALFTRPQIDHRYVVTTVRSDLVSPEQTAWLAQQKFHTVRLPKIDARQTEQWLTSAGLAHNLTLSKKVRQTFIEQNRQGTPGHLLRGLLTVKSTLADQRRGRRQIKAEQVAAVMHDIDAQERQALCRREPLAAYLLMALAHFHAAEVRMAHPLILAYAAVLQRSDRSTPSRGPRWWIGRTLQRTLTYLVNFDVSVQSGLIVAPDTLIEGAEANHARQGVGDFLVAYCRPLQNRWLRRFHRHAEVQRWTIFDLAWGYRERQEHAAAARFYTAAIKVAPHPLYYNNRGSTRAEQGDLAAAIDDFDQAIRLNSQYADAYYNRGNASKAQGDLPAAIADYDQAIALFPNGKGKASAYYNRGNARYNQGDLAAAITDYTEAILLNPQHATAYYNRGLARQAQGDLAAAITDYDEAIRLNPQHATAYYNRGLARKALGQLEATITDYQKAIEMAEALPDQGLRVYLSLGAALRNRAEWAKAQALDDSRLWDWLALADVARRAGNEATWQEALAQARSRLQEGNAYAQACIESVAGNVDAALIALTQAAQAPNFDPDGARQDPDLAWVRADSRFAEIVGKIIDKKDTGTDKLEQAEGERQVTVAETKSANKM